MKKRLLPVLAALLLIIMVLIIGAVTKLIEKYTPTKERVNPTQYFALQDENDIAVILNSELLEVKAKRMDETIYLDYEMVAEYLNSRYYWDSNENLLLYTLPEEVVRTETGSREYTEGKNPQSTDYVILKVEEDKAYIALEYVQKHTNIGFEFFENPNRLLLTSKWGERKTVEAKKEDAVRLKGGIKSPILTDVVQGDTMVLLSEGEDWDQVCTKDGYIGYIPTKKIKDPQTETIAREFEEPVYQSIQKDYKINMVWHQMDRVEANAEVLNKVADTKGVNTISPTWFYLSDNNGSVESIADASYVNYMHQLGIEVWGLIDNMHNEVDTHEVLSYTSKREKVIKQLIAAAIEYDLDGINLDFESLKSETGPAYVQFIRELSVKCRKNGIILSVDNYVPMSYNAFYNRKEQGVFADYVIIMGYDEHFAGSEKSGSVASYDFVKSGIENTLKEVPAEKVINAMPFYTRIWKETPKTEGEIAQEDPMSDYVPYTLSSEAVGMERAAQFLQEYGVTPVWDKKVRQHYGEVVTEEATYKVWLEDEKSIEERLKLAEKYELAGVSAWKLGFEKASIWDLILKYMN